MRASASAVAASNAAARAVEHASAALTDASNAAAFGGAGVGRNGVAAAAAVAAFSAAVAAAAAASDVASAAESTASAALAACANTASAAIAIATDAGGDTAEVDMVLFMRYLTFAATHGDAGGKSAKKLLSSAQRQSDFVLYFEAWSKAFFRQASACGPEEMLRQFCTQRIETAVRVKNAASPAALSAEIKQLILPLFRKLFSRPLDAVTNNAALQFRLFQCKHKFLAETLTLIQRASESNIRGFKPSHKKQAMKFVASQLQLLLNGTTGLMKEKDITSFAKMNRLCCFIPPNALPEILLVFLRKQK